MAASPQAAIDWNAGVSDAWSNVASFVPKLAAFLVILLVGFFVAKLVAKVADKALERIGFDRAVERGGVRKALAKSQYDASDLVAKLVYYALMLLVLQMAFGVFGPNPVSDLITNVVLYLPNVVAAIVIVVVAAAIATAVKDLVTNALGGLSYGTALGTAASLAIITVGAFAALSQLQIAPAIVNGLFYAMLAIIVGSSVIAIGGGGIQPMRQRWENVLSTYDQEKPRLQEQLQGGVVSGDATSDLTASSDAPTTTTTTTTRARSTSARSRR